MDRRFRLTSSSDFQRVRRTGSSYAHPFIVLIAAENSGAPSRIGVTTARGIRRAVDRNRAKRLLREAARKDMVNIEHGWDVVLIARPEILNVSGTEVEAALYGLFQRAGLISNRRPE